MATVQVNPDSPSDPQGEELSDSIPKDSRITSVTNELMTELNKALTEVRGAKPEFLKPVEYKIQEDPCTDDKDTNYFVKLQVGEQDTDFVHVKIAKDASTRRLSVCKLEPEKGPQDEISEF